MCPCRLPFNPRRARSEEIPTRVLTKPLEKEAVQGPREHAEDKNGYDLLSALQLPC